MGLDVYVRKSRTKATTKNTFGYCGVLELTFRFKYRPLTVRIHWVIVVY